jgi:hypothetical protein
MSKDFLKERADTLGSIVRHAGDMQETADKAMPNAATLYSIDPALPKDTDIQINALSVRVKAHIQDAVGEERTAELLNVNSAGSDFVTLGIKDARAVIDGMLFFARRETGTINYKDTFDMIKRSYDVLAWSAVNISQFTTYTSTSEDSTKITVIKPEVLAFAGEQPECIQIKLGTKKSILDLNTLLCGAFRKVPGREAILAQQLFEGVATIYGQCGNFDSPAYIEQRLAGWFGPQPVDPSS